MHVSEGNLAGQFSCDYLTMLAEELLEDTVSQERREEIHEQIVLRNLFFHRMSVDGGFHARVLTAILSSAHDRQLLFDLIRSEPSSEDVLPLREWLKKEYETAVRNQNHPRKLAVSALLRSCISGTNTAAEILVAEGDVHPESWWQMKTRAVAFSGIRNPELYFSAGRRPVLQEYPLHAYAARCAGVNGNIYDAVICIAGVWFSSLGREEMIVRLNMPQVSAEEWYRMTGPLLKLEDDPVPALATAEYLASSGSIDAALDLYAGITLAYPGTDAAIRSFERMGDILRKTGDADNAFEAYKNAFIFSRGKSPLAAARGLRNLCDAGEELGEDMTAYYARTARIADGLNPEDRAGLYLELAASCRKRECYADEYTYLETIITENSTNEAVLSAAMARLTEMNRYLHPDGSVDGNALACEDKNTETAVSLARGDAAYFGFHPAAAIFWYGFAGSTDAVSARIFQAAAAGGFLETAGMHAETSDRKAVLSVLAGYPVAGVAQKLNQAIGEALSDPLPVLRSVFLLLNEVEQTELLELITKDRSTRDDERAAVFQAAARAALETGFPETAISRLRSALRANPGIELRSRIFADIGFAEFSAGSLKAAAGAYQASLKMNASFPAAWAGLAKVLAAQKQYDNALDAAEKAVSLNPAYRHLKCALAEVAQKPILEKPDLQFILGNLPAAAAGYSEICGSFDPGSWDSTQAEELLNIRNVL